MSGHPRGQRSPLNAPELPKTSSAPLPPPPGGMAAACCRGGKTAAMQQILDEAVRAGEHVHIAGADGQRCVTGECNRP